MGVPEISELLDRVRAGDATAEQALLGELYGELHRLASLHMRRQAAWHSLQATELLNEAYLRLIGTEGQRAYASRAHFLGYASQAMRSVLVDHARRRRARSNEKAAGGDEALDHIFVTIDERELDLEALDAALQELETFDPKMARAVELRFFGGLAMEEVAEVLEMPKRSLERRWASTRSWLRRRMQES